MASTLGEHTAKYVSEHTFLRLFVYSDIHDLPDMKKKCFEFTETKSNTLEVLKSPSFLKLPEEYLVSLISSDRFVASEYDILQAVLKWKEYNEKSVEEMEEITKCIRLSRFSTPEMFTKVQPTGLFNEASLFAGIQVLWKPILSEMQPRGRIGESVFSYLFTLIDLCVIHIFLCCCTSPP